MPKETRFEKELKMAGEKTENAIWAFQFFLLVLISIFQQNYHNNHLVLTLNEMVGLYCRDQPQKDPPPFLSGLSGSLHCARIFLTLCLEDPSILRRSYRQGKIQPFACKANNIWKNIWRQDDLRFQDLPGARNFLPSCMSTAPYSKILLLF